MQEIVFATVAWLLVLAFSWAGLAKLLRFGRWRAALSGYGFYGGVEKAVALGVPLVELGVVVLLLFGPARAGAALVLALVALFSLAILNARSVRGDRLPCGCFGGRSERDYRLLLIRNAVLGAAAGAMLLVGRDGSLRAAPGPETSDALPALLTFAGIVLAAWMLRHVGNSLDRKQQS